MEITFFGSCHFGLARSTWFSGYSTLKNPPSYGMEGADLRSCKINPRQALAFTTSAPWVEERR